MSGASMLCPRCNRPIGPDTLQKPRRITQSFETCDRRCDDCGIGFSNGDVPTMIFRNPLHNLPIEVRAGALEAVRASLNVSNRGSKEARLGFQTSEDAVTWTVFSSLNEGNPNALVRLGRFLQMQPSNPPDIYLWGVHLHDRSPTPFLNQVVNTLNAIGEVPERYTEPDVMLDYGKAGLVIIEVKHRAANDVQPLENVHKFGRYVDDSGAFLEPATIKQTRLYELTRNWRLGYDLTPDRPFRLVNLGPPALFAPEAVGLLDTFASALARGGDRSFTRMTWDDFLAELQGDTPLPAWLTAWLSDRGIK